tara:strand:- start:510 stop:1700 length:1191 start_codon:yes stop_codon:yes gene_type:complete
MTTLLFLFSPVLSIPLVLRDIYHNRNSGYILAGLGFLLLSYFFVPGVNGDKAYYFHLYDFFSEKSFSEANFYIRTQMEDYTLYYFILAFSHLGISFSMLSGLVTATNLAIFFYIFRESVIENQLSKFSVLLFFLILIFSLSLPHLFSGIRFYFGSSFVVLGLYLSLVKNKEIKGLTFLLFASTIHYSTFIFFILTFIYILFRKKLVALKILYLTSFIFLILPTDFYSYPLSLLVDFDIDLLYIQKYLGYVIENEFEITNQGHAIYLFFARDLGYYLITIYALLSINRIDNKWFSVLLMALILANITFYLPYLFNRYVLIVFLIFVFILINDLKKFKYSSFFTLSFLMLSIISTSLDILIQRDRFAESYLKTSMLTLPTMIPEDPTNGKVFDKGRLY